MEITQTQLDNLKATVEKYALAQLEHDAAKEEYDQANERWRSAQSERTNKYQDVTDVLNELPDKEASE